MTSNLWEGFFAAARVNKRPFGFMALLAGAAASSSDVTSQEFANRDFFAKTGACLRALAAEIKASDYDFMDLLEDHGHIPQLYALTGIRSAANDTIGFVGEPAPRAPKAA